MPKKTNLDLQTQVLKELTSPASFQWNARESYAKIAKKLAVDEEAVRLVVRQARESGFVEKWRFVLNPSLLGQRAGAVQLDVSNPREKNEIISSLKLVDRVMLIFDFHGKTVRIVFNFETDKELERKLALFRSICQAKEKDTLYWITQSPPCTVKLKVLDWRILKALSKDPRRNLRDVAGEAKVSIRTTNRHLQRMISGKVFYLIPVRNLKKSSGVLCNFVFRCTEDSREGIEGALESIKRRVDFVYAQKGLFNVSLMLDNITAADDLADTIREIHGVEDLRLNIMKNFIFVDSWLDDILERGTQIIPRISSH